VTIKVVVGPTQAAINRTRASGNAAAKKSTDIHPAAARHIPSVYSPGALGWTVPYAIETDGKNTRTAIIADEEFSRGKPDFTGAADKLPNDWADSPVGISSEVKPSGR